MDEKSLKLSWNLANHPGEFYRKSLLTTGHFSDVTLVSEDLIRTPAHKLVLSSCSSFFKTLLGSITQSCDTIFLRGIKQQHLEIALQLIYKGYVEVRENNLEEILSIAANLQIDGFEVIAGENKSSNICDVDSEYLALDTDEDIKDEIVKEKENKSEQDLVSVQEPKETNIISCQEDIVAFSNQEIELDESYMDIANIESEDSKQSPIFKQETEIKINSPDKNDVYLTRICSDCSKSFETHLEYLYHLSKEHEGCRFDCSKCDFQATSEDALKKHYRSEHKFKKTKYCQKCSVCFSSQAGYSYHMSTKHEGLRFPCPQCTFKATSKQVLKYHINAKHGDGQEKSTYICTECNETYSSKPGFKYHMKVKHGDFERHSCTKCNFKTTTKNSLKMHNQSKHEKSQKVKHVGIEDKDLLSCTECDETFSSRPNRRYHITVKHDGVRYACLKCDYQATAKSQLKKHIQAKHEGVRYFCKLCDYKTRWDATLRIHIKIKHKD